MEEMMIRTATLNDVPSITELGSIPELAYSDERHLLAEDYIAHIPCDVFLVAEDDGAVIGFLLAEQLMNHGLILWTMAVAPAHRGRGIGSALLDEALARSRAAGTKWVYATMTNRNPRLRSLYARHGFEFGQDVVEMVKHM